MAMHSENLVKAGFSRIMLRFIPPISLNYCKLRNMKFKEASAPRYLDQGIVIKFMVERIAVASARALASLLCWTRCEGGISVSNHSLLCNDVAWKLSQEDHKCLTLSVSLGMTRPSRIWD